MDGKNPQKIFKIGATKNHPSQTLNYTQSHSKIGNSFHCTEVGHDQSPLNIVCVDKQCRSKGLVCSICSHLLHSKHETIPLKLFLEQYQNSIIQVHKKSEILFDDFQHLNSIEKKIIQILNDFQLRMLQALEWTKNHLVKHFLQEISIFQSLQIRRSEAEEVFKIIQGNFIKNPSDLRDYVGRLISNLDFGNQGQSEIFNLNFFPNNIKQMLDGIVDRTSTTLLLVETDIKKLSETMATGLNGILKAQINISSPQKTSYFPETPKNIPVIQNQSSLSDENSSPGTPKMANELFKIRAHTNTIRDLIEFEQNLIASCSYDNRIKIWNQKNGNLIANLDGHADEVYQLAYSSKYKILASTSYDRTIRFWQKTDKGWECTNILQGHEGKTWGVLFIDSINRLVSSSNDMKIMFWNIKTGECELTLSGLNDTVWSFTYLESFQQIASGDTKNVRIWDPNSGIQEIFFEAHLDRIYSMVELYKIQQKFRGLITSSIDRSVQLWNLDTNQVVYMMQFEFRITTLCVVPNQNQLLVGLWGDSKEGKIQIWNTDKGVKESDLEYDFSGVSQIMYDQQNQKLISSHADGNLIFSPLYL